MAACQIGFAKDDRWRMRGTNSVTVILRRYTTTPNTNSLYPINDLTISLSRLPFLDTAVCQKCLPFQVLRLLMFPP